MQWRRRRRRNQLRSPFSLSGVSKRAHSILLSPLDLSPGDNNRWTILPLLHAWPRRRRLQIAPLFNTLAHNNPPSFLPFQIYSDRKKQIIFPRYFSLRPNIHSRHNNGPPLSLSSLPSHLFCPISLSTRCCNKESHLQQRRSLHVLPTHLPTPYSPSLPPSPFPFNFAAGRPTHCDCEPRLAADCSVTHDTPLFLSSSSFSHQQTDRRTTDGGGRAKSMRERGEERST